MKPKQVSDTADALCWIIKFCWFKRFWQGVLWKTCCFTNINWKKLMKAKKCWEGWRVSYFWNWDGFTFQSQKDWVRCTFPESKFKVDFKHYFGIEIQFEMGENNDRVCKLLRKSRSLKIDRAKPSTCHFGSVLFIPLWLVPQPSNLAFWMVMMSSTRLAIKNTILKSG